MEGLGFIHEKLDIKILILYILNHLPAAVDGQTLSDLVFCDNGIGYFDYSDCLAELVDTAHITAYKHAGGRVQCTPCALGRHRADRLHAASGSRRGAGAHDGALF